MVDIIEMLVTIRGGEPTDYGLRDILGMVQEVFPGATMDRDRWSPASSGDENIIISVDGVHTVVELFVLSVNPDDEWPNIKRYMAENACRAIMGLKIDQWAKE